jgi:hypothetical protein
LQAVIAPQKSTTSDHAPNLLDFRSEVNNRHMAAKKNEKNAATVAPGRDCADLVAL